VLELTRRVVISLAVLAAPLLGSLSCSRSLDADECNLLLDRYTELLVREEDPHAAPARVARAQSDARTMALHDPKFEFSSCSARVSRSSFDCAMKAPSVDEMERCLVF
jgi:hypothetical protein